MKKTKITLFAAILAAFTLTPVSAQVLWTSGHGDIGIGYVAGALEPHWHLGEANETVVLDGSPQNDPAGFEYEPDQILAQTALSGLRPVAIQWSPIGVAGGATYYLFPESENVNTPYIGFGAEELDPLDWTGNITLTLTAMSGPGGGVFSLYQVDLGDPTFFMSTNDGISGADAITIVPGSHTHYNFAFTEQGQYDLTFEISGTHGVDGAKTASATYSFNVIPEPSTYALLMLGMAGVAWLRRRPAQVARG
jgi:surface-anchored protein